MLMTTNTSGERRAVAVVLAMTLLSLGMLGVLVPAPAPERVASVGTVYTPLYEAIKDTGPEELPAQF